MSKEIKCKECGFDNPHSSKFCNNCGAKLPLSTHIICPNCEAPNTRDRVFCDTCGTRLIPETTQLQPEDPEVNQPPPSQPFSLPTRRPGDTGELNPNAVPDWLRTGDIGTSKEMDAEAGVSDTKPEPKDTSDLPEWLVRDSDPEPIINAPTNISTEFYRDLVENAEDLPQPDDLFGDEQDANLPDWLSDAAEAPQEPDVRSGLTDWLSDLQDDGEDDPNDATGSLVESADASGGLTDWLQELDDLNPADTMHEETNAAALDDLVAENIDETAEPADWLQELGPAQTDLFPERGDDLAGKEGDDVPGWMDELGPLQTNLLDPSQIAELTGPLSGTLDEDELVDDEAAGADVTFTNLFETASGLTETLPDWLDVAAEEGETFLSDLPGDLAEQSEPDIISEPGSDWFTADQIVAETDLDWLEETGNLEKLPGENALEESELPDPAAEDELQAGERAVDDEFEAASDPTSDQDDPGLSAVDEEWDLDWLSDMESIQTGELILDPASESEKTGVTPEPIDADETAGGEPLPEPEPEPEEETWSSDSFFAETAVGEDLPDWLERLDEAEPSGESDEPNFENEALPDWIAGMRPSQGFVGSELPGVLSDMDLRDTLEGIPEELAGAELPDWLRDASFDGAPVAPLAESDEDRPMEIPDWLQPREVEEEQGTALAGDDSAEAAGGRGEWRSLLEELPPLTPLAESLPKAEIPEWVQQLKPPELSGEPPREPEGPAETTGPLKGMQGVVAIEPAIARPRAATLPTPYVTTPEQQQQVALLQQLAHETPETVRTLSAKSTYDTAVWLRLLVALLVIAALLTGLLGPSLVSSGGEISANVQAMETAVSASAGRPVLVAFEFTPAMAGELSPQANLLLTQLAANNSEIMIVSQYAAGTAVANSLVAERDAQVVGYLPGEGIGLRQLGDCLAGRNECAQLNGRVLDAELQSSLSQTGLVIVLTGDRDNLVNWIEQVGSVATNVPLVAGVNQALAPLASTYSSTGQLQGLLRGLPDAVAYESLVNPAESEINVQLNAQIYGQTLAGLLLLAGLLTYGVTGFLRRNRAKE